MKNQFTIWLRTCGILGLLFNSSFAFAAGDVLPQPPAPFSGKLDPSRDKAQAAWPKQVQAPAGAPNIVVILLDDVGFSAPATFGGVADTPTLEQLARNGVSYNQFHVTSLCSPTRSAILTGRNHHEVGFGTVADNSSGFPGYNSILSKDTVTLPEVLRQNGYSTAAFGKWHNTPTWEITPAGPYDHWPTSLGFEYFYGFLGGYDSQWEPHLYRNTTPVEPSATPQQGYHQIADLADDASRWLHVHEAVLPNKPFFLWLAPGGGHWPHHAPQEWIEKYKGKFDQGWDKLREDTFARQKKLGVIPANAELTPRPPELPAWDSLSPDEQKLLARQAEVSAAYLAYTDFQLGRVLAAIREAGHSEDTVVFYIAGDNGAALNASLFGTDAYDATGKILPVAERLKRLEKLGGPEYNNLYSAAWGWADNTPFQYGKGIPAYLGGTRNPLVVSWPGKIKDKGGIRSQFSHVTDIAPTIYEITGIKFPEVVEGVAQVPLEGASLVYSFNNAQASTPRTQQYFEIGGNRGIYKDGWWAGSRNVIRGATNDVNGPSVWSKTPFGNRAWELYNLNEDYSQAHDLAAQYPEKVAELAAAFDKEAWRNDVYPLTPQAAGRPNPASGRTLFTYRSGVTRLPSRNGPDVTRRAHLIAAEIVVPAKGGNGVIISDGGRWGGFSLYVKNGKLVYATNAHGNQTGHIVSRIPLPKGKVQVSFAFTPDNRSATQPADIPPGATAPAVPGTGRLFINGQSAGEGKISKIVYSPVDTLDIGADLGSPVSTDYKVPFAFGGTINKVQIELK